MASRKIAKPKRPKRKPLTSQPQSKTAAAGKVGMTLAASDQWSQPYWNPNDMHCKEREVFG
jgi:hypothetical protein